MSRNQNSITGKPRYLSQIELAVWMGKTPRYVRSLTASKTIPSIQLPGRNPIYDLEKVQEALARFGVGATR